MPRISRSELPESLPPTTDVAPSHLLEVREAVEVIRPNQLRHLWHSLWSRTPRASFRQTPEFLEASCSDPEPAARLESRPGNDRWRFMIVSAWQRPIGIVPLREHFQRHTLGSKRTLAIPNSLWGGYPGLVGPHPATTLAAVVRHLVQQDDSWDILELPEVVAQGVDPTRVPCAMKSQRLVIQKSHRELLGLELPASFGQFWADRDAAARQRWRELEARRSIRRDEQFIRFRPGGACHGETDRDWDFLDQLERVVRLQDRTPHAVRSRQLFEQLREMHAATVDAGSADVALWLCDSQPAAFAYNFHCRSRVETALLLADPKIPHATDRLIGMMLRDEIARGDSWHLFLPNSVLGTSVSPQLWRPAELQEVTMTHDRHATIRSRMTHWWNGGRRTTSTSRC